MSGVSSFRGSLWQEGVQRLKKNQAAFVCIGFIFLILLMAATSSFIAPYSFEEQHLDNLLQSPSLSFFMGTDQLGRDLFSRIIYGSRISMIIGIVTAVITLGIGTVYGAISGWYGGWVDSVMMRIVDINYSIPAIVIMIIIKVVFDSVVWFDNPELRALTGTLIALSVVGWVTLARVVRGQVLQLKQQLYVESAKALGAGSIWILLKHVLPNMLGPIIVMLTFRIPANILFESFLSFIGLGLQPPYSSWGVLAADGADLLESYPHLILFPGLFLFLTMMAFQILGDGMRDAFDPKMRD